MKNFVTVVMAVVLLCVVLVVGPAVAQVSKDVLDSISTPEPSKANYPKLLFPVLETSSIGMLFIQFRVE